MSGQTVLGKLKESTPWTFIALVGLAVLAGVDAWRDHAPTFDPLPIVRGSLPNLVAVPVLTFGFLMMQFPKRRSRSASGVTSQRRRFWGLWTTFTLVIALWEFVQLTGNLVFDPLDLVATALGAGLCLPLFYGFEARSFDGAQEP